MSLPTDRSVLRGVASPRRTRGRARIFALSLMALLPLPGLAVAEESVLEEVVVTGSRINRDNASASSPISTVSGEILLQTGSPDLGEALNKNPLLLNSITASNSIDVEPNNVGEADNIGGSALDLRGLGFERTLVLVNGRRHVAGVEGTSSVDISTIPSGLIERVEILTGGASAVYGSDAVSGVVNFILKEDFDGFQMDLQPGISGRLDADSLRGTAIWGRNFGNGRGNITFSAQFDRQEGLRKGDRSHFDNDGPFDGDQNPAIRFQTGDITAADTPNFNQFYDFNTTGRFPVGQRIPDAATFAADYTADFGVAPTLTAAEQALIDRAATAPPQALLPGRTFSITSPYGVVVLGDFATDRALGQEPDLDGNGTTDCLQSFLGYNSGLDGADSFGLAGGCWFIDETGNPVPYVDGLVAGNFNQFGASQSFIAPTREYVLPENQRFSFNLTGHYEFSEALDVFFEGKYVRQETDFGGGGHTFTDLLYGMVDNPFLPQSLVAGFTPGTGLLDPDAALHMSQDPDYFGENISTNERSTMRLVFGARGSMEYFDYEVYANHGRFERRLIDREDLVADRFFAAIDAVTDPATGNPVCRSDLDPTAFPNTTLFNIFPFLGGGERSSFYTFSAGDGQCRPANIWAGPNGLSQEAIDFMTYTRNVDDTITQTVLSGYLSTDTDTLFDFSTQAGPISFVIGGEWRRETSEQEYGDLDNGIIQVDGVTARGTPFSAGDSIAAISQLEGTTAGSLGEDAAITLLDVDADYDVWDIFAEVSIPILANQPLAYELTVDASWRRADYSSFGSNTTYGYGGVYSPVEDLKFRGSFNRAVRVPNLFELSALQGQFFRPRDPCDASNVGAALDPANRQANCVADLQAVGVPAASLFDANGNYIFTDPLSAGFPGTVEGNPDLDPEEADTISVGVVFQPRFLEGLTIAVDYFSIEIDSAIVALNEQNIVNRCYDSPTLTNAFCPLFTRNPDSTSPQSGGFNFLRQRQLNFGAAETSGYDIEVGYQFEALGSFFDLSATVTYVNKLEFTEPALPGAAPNVDDELGEARRPEWASQFFANWTRGPFSLGYQLQYLGEMTLDYEGDVEIETFQQNFGNAALNDPVWIHALNAGYQYSEAVRLYGGVSNLTDESPLVTERSYPVSPIGRYMFAGVEVRL